MKKQVHIIFILVFILGISCSKKDDLVVPTTVFYSGLQTYGWATASKNGLEYSASAFGLRHQDNEDFFSLEFKTYLDTLGIIERGNLFFTKIPFIANEYIVSGPINVEYDGFVGSEYFGLISDGHVLNSTYRLNESYNNTLTVTYVDTIENIIRGTFDVSFELKMNTSPSPDPDRVTFSGGEFETSIVF